MPDAAIVILAIIGPIALAIVGIAWAAAFTARARYREETRQAEIRLEHDRLIQERIRA